jgi:hypothetical protein
MYPTEPIGSAPPPPPQGLLDRDWQRILVFLLTLLAGAAVLWVLWQIVSPILRTLVLFALAAVLAFALSSPVNMVARRIGNRVAAIVLVYLLVGIIVVGHARLWPSQEHQCDNGRGEQRVVGRAAVVRRVGKERSHVFQDERAGVVVAQAADPGEGEAERQGNHGGDDPPNNLLSGRQKKRGERGNGKCQVDEDQPVRHEDGERYGHDRAPPL